LHAGTKKLDRFEQMKKILLFGSLFSMALVSCLEENNLPDTPAITFNRFDNFTDSINLVINFQDGDGNFGLEQGDTSGIFDDCLRYYNLYCIYQEKQNGVWVDNGNAAPGQLDPCVNEDAVPFYYRIPWAKPTGQDQTQDGTITINMNTYYLPSTFDTCRFRVKIVDRDLQESNEIFTAEFYKP
jgi:hypothetical protein